MFACMGVIFTLGLNADAVFAATYNAQSTSHTTRGSLSLHILHASPTSNNNVPKPCSA